MRPVLVPGYQHGVNVLGNTLAKGLVHECVEHGLREIAGVDLVSRPGERQRERTGTAAHVKHGLARFDSRTLDEGRRIRTRTRNLGVAFRTLVPALCAIGMISSLLLVLPGGGPIDVERHAYS